VSASCVVPRGELSISAFCAYLFPFWLLLSRLSEPAQVVSSLWHVFSVFSDVGTRAESEFDPEQTRRMSAGSESESE
jgi:hypothetical protein